MPRHGVTMGKAKRPSAPSSMGEPRPPRPLRVVVVPDDPSRPQRLQDRRRGGIVGWASRVGRADGRSDRAWPRRNPHPGVAATSSAAVEVGQDTWGEDLDGSTHGRRQRSSAGSAGSGGRGERMGHVDDGHLVAIAPRSALQENGAAREEQTDDLARRVVTSHRRSPAADASRARRRRDRAVIVMQSTSMPDSATGSAALGVVVASPDHIVWLCIRLGPSPRRGFARCGWLEAATVARRELVPTDSIRSSPQAPQHSSCNRRRRTSL